MHEAGGEAWAVSIGGADADHVFALYVREALDLPTQIDVPEPLFPPVALLGVLSTAERMAAAEEWTTWWRTLLAGIWQARQGTPRPAGPPFDSAGLGQLLLDPFQVQASSPLTAGVVAVSRDALDYLGHRAEPVPTGHTHGGLDYDALVASLARKRGRRPRDFYLEIEVFPVAGSRQWTVGVDHERALAYLHVTADFRTHPERHRPAIVHTLAEIL